MAEPHIHFKGRPGEQATMFLPGSCGNTPEFKPFADRAQLSAMQRGGSGDDGSG